VLQYQNHVPIHHCRPFCAAENEPVAVCCSVLQYQCLVAIHHCILLDVQPESTRVLQCVAVRCRASVLPQKTCVLQCVAVCHSVLQRVAVCSTSRFSLHNYIIVYCFVLEPLGTGVWENVQCMAVYCSGLQCSNNVLYTAFCWNLQCIVLFQWVPICCRGLQRFAVRCSTLPFDCPTESRL